MTTEAPHLVPAPGTIPVPANPELPGMPLERRVNRAELHLEILRTLNRTDWETFAGLELEHFVDWMAAIGVEVWYTQPGGIGGRFSDRLHSWYTDAARSALTWDNVPIDLPERFLARAHAHGILVVATFNMNLWVALAKLHPEWLIQDLPDGRQIRPNETFLCHNSPFGDYLREYLVDYVQRYPVDGVWFDDCNFGSRSASPFPAGCLCRWCADLFREQAGGELPLEVDWSSEAFRRWVSWRYDNLSAFQDRIAHEVRAARSPAARSPAARSDGEALTVRFNSYPRPRIPWTSANPLQPIDGESQFFIETEYPLLGPHLTAKLARARGDCEIWGHAPQPLTELGSALYQEPALMARVGLGALANGVFAECPIDYGQVAQMEPVFASLSARRELVGGASIRRVAVHLSQQTRDFHYAARADVVVVRDAADQARTALAGLPDVAPLLRQPILRTALADLDRHAEGSDEYWRQWVGFAEMLEQDHLPFDVMFDRSLLAGERKGGLEAYRTLVLPNSVCLSDAECARISEWVEAGGTLVASYETSLRDEWGARREDFGLGEALGVRYRGTYDAHGNGGSIYMMRGDPLGAVGEWIAFNGQHTEIDPRSGVELETVATLSVLKGIPHLPRGSAFYAGAGDDLDSGHLAVTCHQFGRGQAVYVSGDVGTAFASLPLPRLRALVGGLVARGGRLIKVEAPSRLLVAARWSDPGVLQVHLYERMLPMVPWDHYHPDVQAWSAIEEPIRFHNVAVTVVDDEAGVIRAARLLPGGEALQVRDGCSVVVPELELHAVVELELGSG